ncbi:hypothetical protein HPP92_013153 [Vanilla planifolia]|uniref:Uncharacterized protein n=1 Tax=Vanilla planifolia TaxID=51239 RepID=A0A835QX31_VANPL|nr:hypothetical protein HPP92_013153 [Vanilla planifolia]
MATWPKSKLKVVAFPRFLSPVTRTKLLPRPKIPRNDVAVPIIRCRCGPSTLAPEKTFSTDPLLSQPLKSPRTGTRFCLPSSPQPSSTTGPAATAVTHPTAATVPDSSQIYVVDRDVSRARDRKQSFVGANGRSAGEWDVMKNSVPSTLWHSRRPHGIPKSVPGIFRWQTTFYPMRRQSGDQKPAEGYWYFRWLAAVREKKV